MLIGIIGATGFVGHAILKEALDRNHNIVAVSRTRDVETNDKIIAHKETIFNKESLLKAFKNVDVIISAYHPGYFHVNPHQRFLEAYDLLKEVSIELDKKLVMVLSATSLLLPGDVSMDEDLSYPQVWKNSMSGAKAVYEKYVSDFSFKWTMVSPAAILINGFKTKDYLIGENHLILDKSGEVSKISVQDLANAILDEVENPKFINKRFTLGYR